MDEPRPQSIRDLRLMYETTRRFGGNIEYENLMPNVLSSRDYHDGDITGMMLRVVPSSYSDIVTVCVQREQVTNLREDGCYCPKRLTDWSKEYTFSEFKESPFYQMCIDSWDGCSWDTHEMDEHEVYDDDTRWGVYAHVYEHDDWRKTGRIDAVDFYLDEDGSVEIGLSRYGKRNCFFNGDVWELQRIVDEHQEMKEKLDRLKEHGVDLENGTLSIELWGDK